MTAYLFVPQRDDRISLFVIWHERKTNMNLRYTNKWVIIICAISIFSCTNEGVEYSKFKSTKVSAFDLGFAQYCNLDLSSNFELNAVKCSFYGDYQNALDQATKRESVSNDPRENIFSQSGDNSDIIKSLESILRSNDAGESDKESAEKMLQLLSSPNAKELVNQANSITAIDFITNKSKDYHYTLINEAHYNSQHRSFTKSLLQPLWGQGYRYLALETLSHIDSVIYERGYPINSTGYYTKDSNFGNLIREAIKIGFKLIPYETENGNHGTLRDKDQAENIFNETFRIDKKGKVLIHAGYSHITETGDSGYDPMGSQLKKLINQDVLTIDQATMIGYNDISKQHPYYRAAVENFSFKEPTILLNKDDNVIVDPINLFGIDIQVYHPETKYSNGRPDWIYQKGYRSIPLPSELKKFSKYLIQAVKDGEEMDAIPVDQFVISEEKVLILPKGNYDLRIVNCEGDLISTVELEVN